jgi:hypothetical protein
VEVLGDAQGRLDQEFEGILSEVNVNLNRLVEHVLADLYAHA